MTFLYFFAITFFLLCCFLLCMIILLQEGKGGGLGVVMGGEASDSLFGTSTPEILKKITAFLAAVFVVLCVVLSFWTSSLARRTVHTPPLVEESDISQ